MQLSKSWTPHIAVHPFHNTNNELVGIASILYFCFSVIWFKYMDMPFYYSKFFIVYVHVNKNLDLLSEGKSFSVLSEWKNILSLTPEARLCFWKTVGKFSFYELCKACADMYSLTSHSYVFYCKYKLFD